MAQDGEESSPDVTAEEGSLETADVSVDLRDISSWVESYYPSPEF